MTNGTAMWVQVAVRIPAVDPPDHVADWLLRLLPRIAGEDGAMDR